MHSDFGHVRDPQRLVVREVELVDLAIRQRDLVAHDRAQPVADAALHLGADDVRVHRDAAVDRTGDLVDLDGAVVDRDLGNFRHIGVEGLVDRYTHMLVGCAPAGFLGRQTQNASQALLILGPTIEQRQAEVDRIGTRRLGGHIDQALHRVGRVRVPDRAPPEHRHWALRIGQPDRETRDLVMRVLDSLDRHVVDPVVDQHRLERPALQDGLGGDPMVPADDLAVLQADLRAVRRHRPVVAATNVVLARPDQMHGRLAIQQIEG